MTIPKRLLLSLALLLVLVVAGSVCIVWLAPRHRITAENIEKIQPGMSRQDVEALLRAPAGFEARGRKASFSLLAYVVVEMHGNSQAEWWVGEEQAVAVVFDADGHALKHLSAMAAQDTETYLDKLRRWLHL